MRSFKKFHEGSLDLTGRSERRYSSLKSRMALFLEDVENLRRHSTRTEKRRQIIDQIVVEVDYKITPRSLLSEFYAKYKLSDVWLDELFREADEVKSLLLDGSTPVFQKLYLLDLPPELILHIMELSGVHGARHLAATCRSLRTVSLSYIYQSRRLVMEFSPTLRDANGEQLKREAASAYARSHAQDMQKKLLKDAIFLLSGPPRHHPAHTESHHRRRMVATPFRMGGHRHRHARVHVVSPSGMGWLRGSPSACSQCVKPVLHVSAADAVPAHDDGRTTYASHAQATHLHCGHRPIVRQFPLPATGSQCNSRSDSRYFGPLLSPLPSTLSQFAHACRDGLYKTGTRTPG